MIRVGIGGWTFEPWRGSFYPKGLKQADELRHASRQVTAIEINGTFYRTQSPDSFRKWRDETPDDFVFALKGHRFVTNRKVLAKPVPASRPSWGAASWSSGRSSGRSTGSSPRPSASTRPTPRRS